MMKPKFQSCSARRSRTTASTRSSSTRCPAAIVRFTWAPSLVWCWTFQRKMSPTLMCSRSRPSAISLAWVPLPLPWMPMMMNLWTGPLPVRSAWRRPSAPARSYRPTPGHLPGAWRWRPVVAAGPVRFRRGRRPTRRRPSGSPASAPCRPGCGRCVRPPRSPTCRRFWRWPRWSVHVSVTRQPVAVGSRAKRHSETLKPLAVTRKANCRPGSAAMTWQVVAQCRPVPVVAPELGPGGRAGGPAQPGARLGLGDHSPIRATSATIDQTCSAGASISRCTLTCSPMAPTVTSRGSARRGRDDRQSGGPGCVR